MTLIAGYTVENWPVLLGDILVSHEGGSRDTFNLPSRDGINEQLHGRANISLTGLRQKVNVVDDNLIVAWAGNLVQARAVIRELRDLSASGELNKITVAEYLRQVPEAERTDLSIIALHRGKTHTDFAYCGTNTLDLPWPGNFHIAGSGASTIANILKSSPKHVVPTDLPSNLHGPAAVAYGLWIASQVVGIEFAHGINLFDAWGGAIEVATFNRGKATKVGNTLFTFWLMKDNPDGIGYFNCQPLFLKVEYHKDILLLRVLTSYYEGEELKPFRHRVFAVPPLLYESGNETLEIDLPKLTHDKLCTFILRQTAEDKIDFCAHVLDTRKVSPLRFIEKGSQLEMEMAPAFYKLLGRVAFENFFPDMKLKKIRMKETTPDALRKLDERLKGRKGSRVPSKN